MDAFFFTTHILAIEALRYFYDRGIDINDGNWGLACMHEDSLFRVLAPKMNIAHFPIEEIGSNAVRILLNQIRIEGAPLPDGIQGPMSPFFCPFNLND